MAKWIACHDTLVCFGAKNIQKWCVRVGDDKGELVAVMLTKDVAHLLAAAPDLLGVVRELIGAIKDKSIQRNPAYSSDDIKWLDKRARAAIAKAGVK